MTDVAIRGTNVGKRYTLGRRESYGQLRETIANAFAAFGKKRESGESSGR